MRLRLFWCELSQNGARFLFSRGRTQKRGTSANLGVRMLHWVPAPALAFVGARSGGEEGPADADTNTDRCVQSLRAMHALMLAYAGQRRRAALNPVDAHYWKAAGSHAVGKAEAIRVGGSFPRLP